MDPEQHENAVNDFDPTIRVFHVGGRGLRMGPVANLLKIGRDLEFSIFEANLDDSNEEEDWQSPIWKYARDNDIKLSIIRKCLFNCVGKRNFHINVMPECSSLLTMSPNAANFQRFAGDGTNDFRLKWGQICRPSRTVEIDVTTMDQLHADREVLLPHFISVDVQGAEYEVLEGASKAFNEDLLGVLTEVEFRELYDGQKLFTDQFSLLKEYRIDLFDLYNTEYWCPGPLVGKGTMVVSEALFLRNFRYFVEKYSEHLPLLSNLTKLAAVAWLFERSSYACEILEFIMNNLRPEWETLIEQSDCKYLNRLVHLYDTARAYESRMEELPDYVDFMAGRRRTTKAEVPAKIELPRVMTTSKENTPERVRR